MRNVVFIFIATVVSLVGFGCSRNAGEDDVVSLERIPTKNLRGEVMAIPGLEAPSRVYFHDSSLFFKDNVSKEAQLYVHDLRTGVTRGHVKFGRGPGEMLGAFYFAFTETPEATLVYDVSLDNILMAKTDSLLVDGYYPREYYVSEPLGRKVSCITGYGDRLVCLGGADVGRVLELSRDGEVKVISGYSPDLRNGLKDEFTMRAYEGVIKADRKKEACVIACRYADQVEIVDLKTGRPLFVKGYENFEPGSKVVMVRGTKTLAHDREERKGYVDVCCSKDYIAALYSGKKTKEKKSSYGRSLRLLSWKGKLIDEFILDRDVLAIDLDPENEVLYAIADSSRILRYELR